MRWNGTFLEPAHRTLPQGILLKPGQTIVICRGGTSCRLEQCTFAHDTQELRSLNEQVERANKFEGY